VNQFYRSVAVGRKWAQLLFDAREIVRLAAHPKSAYLQKIATHSQTPL